MTFEGDIEAMKSFMPHMTSTLYLILPSAQQRFPDLAHRRLA
jgi:hypothetical protein